MKYNNKEMLKDNKAQSNYKNIFLKLFCFSSAILELILFIVATRVGLMALYTSL